MSKLALVERDRDEYKLQRDTWRAAAEAAERERDDANIEAALEQTNAREAWGRVAELEAQLAAQGWRPVTEEWPEKAEIVELVINGYRDSGDWYYNDDGEPPSGWRPLPAPPQEQPQ